MGIEIDYFEGVKPTQWRWPLNVCLSSQTENLIDSIRSGEWSQKFTVTRKLNQFSDEDPINIFIDIPDSNTPNSLRFKNQPDVVFIFVNRRDSINKKIAHRVATQLTKLLHF